MQPISTVRPQNWAILEPPLPPPCGRHMYMVPKLIESSLTRLPDLIVEDPISICLTCFHFISKVETLLLISNLLSSQIWVQRKMEKGQMH